MTIDFQANQAEIFTRVFFDIQETTTRYVVVFGGASSSKSYSAHQLELINIMQPGKGDTLIIRKNGADIRESCYKLITSLIDLWDIKSLFKINYSNDLRKVTFLETGRSIIFKGIDDAEKLKSVVGIKRIVIEEANQLVFEDFTELNRRARGIEGIQIILILNPISENHWIKTKLCDVGGPYHAETTLLRVTYKDNCNLLGESFLTIDDIRHLEMLKTIDENQYRIYVLGEWGIDNKEGKFCWAYDSTQAKATEREEGVLLWATFDFNVSPLTCTIAQVFPESKTLRALECIKLDNSDIWKMCDRLKASYLDAIWMITGDATGQSRSAAVADNMNYFLIIKNELNITSQQLEVPPVNPRVKENRILINAVHKNWNIEIDPVKCAPLIYDLQYVEVDGKGEIMKDRSSTKKFADFLDNWRYLINVAVRPHLGW